MGERLDVMPAIPLARGVPIFGRLHGTGEGGRSEPVKALVEHQREDGEGYAHYKSCSSTFSGADVRVDLDEPQGFGYALRWFAERTGRHYLGPYHPEAHLWRRIEDRWFCGATTDADRLALAKACAEVTR